VIVYVPAGIALVLTVALKFPCAPLNGPMGADAVLAVTVPVPDGTELFPALSLPLTPMLGVPWLIVCDPLRFLKVGDALLTSRVPVTVRTTWLGVVESVPVTVKL